MRITCQHCNSKNKPAKLFQYTYDPEELDRETLEPPSEMILFKCTYCNKPILIQDHEIDNFEPILLYPNNETELSSHIPESIKTLFYEMINCEKIKANNSVVFLCRKTIEITCLELGEKSQSLIKNLINLKNKGLIDQNLFDWANTLRLEGNKAVHSIKSNFAPTHLRDIIEFTQAILNYIFVYRKKFEKFKEQIKTD